MSNFNLSEEELNQICEDAFINVKEACMRLQEKTKCSNDVVIEMLNGVSQYYIAQNNDK